MFSLHNSIQLFKRVHILSISREASEPAHTHTHRLGVLGPPRTWHTSVHLQQASLCSAHCCACSSPAYGCARARLCTCPPVWLDPFMARELGLLGRAARPRAVPLEQICVGGDGKTGRSNFSGPLLLLEGERCELVSLF